ncbi:hypothetical protein KMZ93_20230 [Bradyrhizobium sediminis]|uniref:Uncharacterized protein n=1 Tax=Bradyrhizobium sediminis TaxID=2840469 RepID=A0A975NX53_9BRAD|nr:hypothetical protein [Bradyrhizobium sediminis]QWG22281.1 hypothetical protein KMZ93_20230 [Bradyrhizobium sediminis]
MLPHSRKFSFRTALVVRPPQGQLIPAPPVVQAKAGQTGQMFAITPAPPASFAPDTPQAVPNICLGATSAFGIQIVRLGPDGQARGEGSVGSVTS